MNASSDVLSSNKDQNVKKVCDIFSYPANKDFLIKNIYIKSINKNATLLYMNAIIDKKKIDNHIISPLINTKLENPFGDIGTVLLERVLTVNFGKKVNNYNEITNAILNGDSILFIEKYNSALQLFTTKFEHRNIDKPTVENTLKGPKEAFTEWNEGNRSLIRKSIKNPNLITEILTVGNDKHNEVYLMYINNIASPKLVEEVKARINRITADSLEHASLLEQWIEDRPYSILPSTFETERPDRVSFFLKEGHIALLIDSTPNVIIVPVTFWTFLHTSEDMYQRWLYGNFLRILRIFAFFTSMFVPALFIALSTFHVDMIPTDLVYAIAASREAMPFPILMEIILMEISFELIREAGIRIPTTIGPTIGIVGALILGQAAVQANIVSPILVIVVALTGLSSFAIPEMNLSFMVRIGRFLLLIAGAVGGLFGVGLLSSAFLVYACAFESFGVPFLSPKAPFYPSSKDFVLRRTVFNQKKRPMNLEPQEEFRQK